jgi:ABC-type antimicrobial peptide transport system permease subunit
MALLLGIVGIYGVVAYTVTQRRREIGIRVALGAARGQLERMFVGQGVRLALLGVICGSIAAVSAVRVLASLLFGTNPVDPATYCFVGLGLITAAALASYLPAHRAASVDPMVALRTE